MAGEIAPLCRDPGMAAIEKELEKFQEKGNGLWPSVTLTHHPLNNYSETMYGILLTSFARAC
jgi:hypothetical protein